MAGKITSMSKIKQVFLMHRNGLSNRAIAKTIGLDKCTVNEYIRKIKADPLSLDALLNLEEPKLDVATPKRGRLQYVPIVMRHFLFLRRQASIGKPLRRSTSAPRVCAKTT